MARRATSSSRQDRLTSQNIRFKMNKQEEKGKKSQDCRKRKCYKARGVSEKGRRTARHKAAVAFSRSQWRQIELDKVHGPEYWLDKAIEWFLCIIRLAECCASARVSIYSLLNT